MRSTVSTRSTDSTRSAKPPTIISRLRIRRLRRIIGPLTFWGVTLVVASISAQLISRNFTETNEPFGPSQLVAISTRDLEVGHKITQTDLLLKVLPTAVSPIDAVTSVERLIGKRLAHATAAGRPILARDVTGLATSSLAAKVGSGYRGVMIDLPGVPLKVSPGDHVDLLIARDGDGLAEMAVGDAVVIDRLETGVLLRIPEAQLATLAGSLVRGRPLLAIRGG